MRIKTPKILAVASAADLDFRYGCTPAWWQLWKGLHDEGVDLVFHRRNSTATLAVQVNGKMRGTLDISPHQSEEEIKALTASLKEQASQIQKVSAQFEVAKPAPRTIANNQ